MIAYVCKTVKKSGIKESRSLCRCTPLAAAAAGLGASRAAAKPSLPSSSLASRFRFDEELIDAGEAGRDNEDAAATPLT